LVFETPNLMAYLLDNCLSVKPKLIGLCFNLIVLKIAHK